MPAGGLPLDPAHSWPGAIKTLPTPHMLHLTRSSTRLLNRIPRTTRFAPDLIHTHKHQNQQQHLRTLMSVTTHASLTRVSTTNAPAAIGPYSQAVKAGDLVFVSGCIPLDPASGQIVEGGIEAQTEQAMKNLRSVVEASGTELGKVVKTTVFLKSMNDFATVNGIYAKHFDQHAPARSAVEVARLPKDVLVEVECIASLK